MNSTNSLTLNSPQRVSREAEYQPLDLTATYRFPFFPQRWLAGLSTIVQSGLMLSIGGFLLSQIPETPQLVTQMAIIGVLFVGGGLYVLTYAWNDVFGNLTIDRSGVMSSSGWSSFEVPWSDIARWRVNEHGASIPEVSSLTIWTSDLELPLEVPGGRLSERDHHRLRQLFSALAEGQEVA